ncbi:CBASS cGAMP synthase [uncultured Tolumonas sp.]|uniref:CBASS cGAMP synthase n=1 Tax=uncultured Tolumonas sp. TaxID=263765 RepID=UPI00292DE580|nr:CBASS cGAMP synthase [uncultured Tolumonas sp.]
MKWSAHQYFTDTKDGLIKRLEPTSEETVFLESIKEKIRIRTKAVFAEAKEVVRSLPHSRGVTDIRFVEEKVQNTRLHYLDKDDIKQVVELLLDMKEEARQTFLSTRPKFRIQGSYKYKTLNKPYHLPPQQMDIDDGTYMPMGMFKSQPHIGHKLLLLLVDASLASLVDENSTWEAQKKPTCGRIVIKNENVHVDVPMYAIPPEQFIGCEDAQSVAMGRMMESVNKSSIHPPLILDRDCVYLAVRGKDTWIKSDPETVAGWFTEAIGRHGESMRQICRYLKAWRDVQWKDPELSSIALMKCVVDTFNFTAMPDTKDHSELLLKVTEQLATKLSSGVQSPDDTDSRLLFPKESMNGETVAEVIDKAKNLYKQLHFALNNTSSKGEVLQILNGLFGKGVVREELIKPYSAMPAYQQPPQHQQKKQMSESMKSG